MVNRNRNKKILDTVTFPLRAIIACGRTEYRFLGLSSFSDERYDYVSSIAGGYCLDIGCGSNRFVKEYMRGNGIGIDVYKHEGLIDENVIKDLTKLPFNSQTFDSITFIANISHVPKEIRDAELGEAYRCLKPKGKIVITSGNPVAELIVHNMGFIYYDVKAFLDKKKNDGPSEKDDELFVPDKEIISRLKAAGFKNINKKYFITQWFLNHMIIAEK
jgi:ubiquinone/menaquinone biosynthesis C-methylase UbiE